MRLMLRLAHSSSKAFKKNTHRSYFGELCWSRSTGKKYSSIFIREKFSGGMWSAHLGFTSMRPPF